MANFTVRVELLGYADIQAYQRLEAAMLQAGFGDEMRDGEVVYELPPAEYFGVDLNLTTIQVRDLVVKTVATVWQNYRVFVTQSNGRWEHYNLNRLR